MASISLEMIKPVNFEKLKEVLIEGTEQAAQKDVLKLKDLVQDNIKMHNNIDTRTLIDNLKTEVSSSDQGYVTTFYVESDGSSYPTGPKMYAPDLEKSYPNFVPALEKMDVIVVKSLGRIKLEGG